MNNFNTRNAHQRDQLLNFNAEEHIYTHNSTILKSVTTLVEECFEKFDTDYWAPRIAAKRGISETELRKQWEDKADEARTLGTLMHDKIEKYYLGENPTSDETYHLFEEFTKEYKLNPYRTEWAIFDEDLQIAGTLDFLEYSNNEFTIYDWKRSDKIIGDGEPIKTNRYNKTAFPPISNIPDTTYWHYALQVSIYRYILKRKYGINVAKGRLAVFHPSNSKYYVVDVPYLEEEVKLLFK